MIDDLIEELEERMEELERESKFNWCMLIHLNKEFYIRKGKK